MRYRTGMLCTFCVVLMGTVGVRAADQRSDATAATRPEATTRPDMSAVTAPKAVVRRNISFGEDGSKQQRLDVYIPAHVSKAPIVLFVHGGEWTKGDKSEVSSKPKFFNEHGIVFVSTNYRLSGTAQHPAQVNDVAAAVRWVRDHAGEIGGDPARIVLMGHSAGCHLVSFVGLEPRPLARVELKPSDLKLVVSWSGGAFDLVEKVKSGGMYAGYIRKNFGESEANWRDASPMKHVGDARPVPRFLFVSAEEDKPESRKASERMSKLVQGAGGKADYAVLKGKSHFTANHELGAHGDTSGEMLLQFIHGPQVE